MQFYNFDVLLETAVFSCRSNGPTNGKVVYCNEPGCGRSFISNRILQKHIAASHPNDVNNNAVDAADIMRQTDGCFFFLFLDTAQAGLLLKC